METFLLIIVLSVLLFCIYSAFKKIKKDRTKEVYQHLIRIQESITDETILQAVLLRFEGDYNPEAYGLKELLAKIRRNYK